MAEDRKAIAFEKTIVSENRLQSAAVMENRLEALRVLSNSILREIESLKKAEDAVLPGKIDLYQEVERFEKDLIRCALLRTGGRQRQAARLLNIKVTTLNAKIKRYRITAKGIYQEN
jgi:DNA-binding NtrC family response regulator